MEKESIIDHLVSVKKKIKFFKGLSDEQIRILIESAVFKKYGSNEVIFSQGENKDDYIYYIVKGYVNITLRDQFGVRKTVATVYENSIIGEMKPILHEDRTAGCVSGAGGTVVIGFTIKQYEPGKNGDAYAVFYKNMSYLLAQKILETNKRVK